MGAVIRPLYPHIRYRPPTRKPHNKNLNPQGAKTHLTTHLLSVIIDPNPTKFDLMLPTTTPAEVLTISPEHLEIANCYLQLCDSKKVAEMLDVPIEIIVDVLKVAAVKRYIDHVFMETGFNNQHTMRKAMDAVIQKKFQEMEEAGTGSTKDIADLLALSHKMSMEQLHLQLELEKLKQKDQSIKNQVNVQINEGVVGDNSRYGDLINRLLGGDRA